jgi:hypothetical protein
MPSSTRFRPSATPGSTCSPACPATTIPNDSGTLTIFGILIFIGSLGVPVIADLLNLRRSRTLSLHTRLTLGWSSC